MQPATAAMSCLSAQIIMESRLAEATAHGRLWLGRPWGLQVPRARGDPRYFCPKIVSKTALTLMQHVSEARPKASPTRESDPFSNTRKLSTHHTHRGYWARAARMATRYVQRGLASLALRAVPPAAFRRLPSALRCQRCPRRMGCCLSGSAANGPIGSSAAARLEASGHPYDALRLAASGHIYDALLPAGNQLRSALAFRFSPSSLCPWVDGALLSWSWGMSHGPWHA